MAKSKTNLTKSNSAKAKKSKALEAQSAALNQGAPEHHSQNDLLSLSQTKKNIRTSDVNTQTNNEQDLGQTLASAKSAMKFNQYTENTYDVSKLNTGLFETDSIIASSASTDARSGRGWQKYVWYSAAGIGLVGAGVVLANSGGGGDGSSAPTISDINNFEEFCASGLFVNPTVLNLTLNSDSYEYILDNGFVRPESFANFNFGALDYASLAGLNVGPSGLAINVNTQEASIYAGVYADASYGESEVIWMENLSITSGANNTNYANVVFDVYANANSGSADAEIGICDLSVDIESESGNARGVIAAYATGSSGTSEANVYINDLEMNIVATEAASNYLSVYASATNNAQANVSIGNLNMHATLEGSNSLGGSVLVGVGAYASDSSTATVSLGNVSISAESERDGSAALAAVGSIGQYNSLLGADASDYSTASVNVDGNIDIDATVNGQDSLALASFGFALNTGNSTQYATINATATSDYASATVTVDGDINIAALATDKFSEANASFANHTNGFYGEDFGNLDVFEAGIMASVGEDNNTYSVYNSEASVNLGDINITADAVRESGDAKAIFVVGEDANRINAQITANNQDITNNGEDGSLNDTSASVDIGAISISASAQDTAYAGMVLSSSSLFSGQADSVRLDVTASIDAYDNGDNNHNSVNIEAITLDALVTGVNADALAFLTTGGEDQQVEIQSTLFSDGENNSTSVDIGDITITAESESRDSNATAFGSGRVSIYDGEDFDGSFAANVEMSATNYGWENTTSSLVIGNIEFTATTDGRTSYAEAFVAGQLSSNMSIESDFDIGAWTLFTSEGLATTDIGNISVTATTLDKNSEALAFISGQLNAEVDINPSDDLTSIGFNGTSSFGEDLDVQAQFTIEAGGRGNGVTELTVDNISVLADASAVNSKASHATAFLVGDLSSMSDVRLSDDNTDNAAANTDASATSTAYVSVANYAHAEFKIFAEADDNAETTLEVGNISVVADAGTTDIEDKDATAYMVGNVFAESLAYATAIATANGESTDGNIAVNAQANAYAYADAYASAYAEVRFDVDTEENSSGTLSIGDVSIEATSGRNGDALAYMAGFARSNTLVDALETATASPDNGGTLSETVDTPEQETASNKSRVNVNITASSSGYSTASLTLDSITVSAFGGSGNGDAEAFMAGYGEDARVDIDASASDYSDASLTIGDITITASKSSGSGDVNAYMVGQATNLSSGEDGVAGLYIDASQSEYGTATVDIGSIEVGATADDGVANAALSFNGYSSLGTTGQNLAYVGIEASATGYIGSATTTIESIKVSAISDEQTAYAALATSNTLAYANLASRAQGDLSSNLDVDLVSVDAALNITNGIEVSAEAQRNAYAALVLADDGFGDGEDGAYGTILAHGEDGGHATTSIENITITATSHNGDAYAGTNFALSSSSTAYIRAYSDGEDNDNSSAQLDILGGISVTADAQNDAIAMIDNISTTAYWSGESVIDIGNISLTAMGEGYTSAYISDIGARASYYAAAETNVENITINVGGNDADNAYAYINLQAEARDDSNATVTIGDISMVAEADLTGGDAQVNLDINTDTYDFSSTQDSFALVDVGNIDLSVTGGDGDDTYVNVSFYADVNNDGAASRIQAGDITLTSHVSTMDDGEDTVYLNIRAEDINYASVSVGDISVNLLGDVGSSAYVNVGGYYTDIDQIDIGNLAVNIENANSNADIYIRGVAADYDRTISINGAGDVNLYLDTNRDFGDQMAFNKIYLTDVSYDYQTVGGNISVDVDTNHTGSLNFRFGDTNINDTELSLTGNLTFESDGGQQDLIAHTTIYGYDTSGSSSISFNGTLASNEDFFDISNASPETSANDLWQSIADTLDDAYSGDSDWFNHVYIYNTVDEGAAGDINGDGYLSDSLGVLTYSEYGNDYAAVSAIVFLNDMNGTIQEENISGGFIG